MKKIASLILAAAMLLALAACGSGSKSAESSSAAPATSSSAPAAQSPAQETAPAAPADSPAGSYKMTGMTSDGEEQDMSELTQLGMIYYLVLDADGTGYMEMFGERDALTWNDKAISGDDGSPAEYEYADGVLTVNADGDKLVFTRLTEEELAYYKEHGSGSIEDLFGNLGGVTSENSGDVGEYHVSFVGAEPALGYGETPAIRFWYDFTNNSDKITSASSVLFFGSEQDGEQTDMSFIYDDIPESDYDSCGVAPGCTIRCAVLYTYNPEGGPVVFSAGDFIDSVTYTVDPKALPGAPADQFAFTENPGVKYCDSYSDAGRDVEILGFERGKDWNDNDILILKLRFTNNTGDSASLQFTYTVYVMQDGYSLPQTFSVDSDALTEGFSKELAAGESVECAYCCVPRTSSPVAVVLSEYLGSEYFCGGLYELPAA